MWARQAVGSLGYHLHRITVSPNGTIFLFGGGFGKGTFGSLTTNKTTQYAIFVAKMDKAGTFQWVASFPADQSSWSMRIKADNKDNVYITGRLSGPATFGTKTLTLKTGAGTYIAKIDAKGKLLWATQPKGPGDVTTYNLALDSKGHPHITGEFSGAVTFGMSKLSTALQSHQAFVAKLDPTGAFQWAVQTKGTSANTSTGRNYVTARGLAIDQNDNLCVSGFLESPTTFGKIKTTETFKHYVATLSPQGNFTKVTTWGGQNRAYVFMVKVDKSNNVYVYFSLTKSIQLGSLQVKPASPGWGAMVLAKMDTTGRFLWARKVESNRGQSVWQYFSIDGLDRIHVVGFVGGKVQIGDKSFTHKPGESTYTVATFNTQGKLLDYNMLPQTKPINNQDSNILADITSDQQGNTYVIGSIYKTANFIVDPLTNKGMKDLFITKNLP